MKPEHLARIASTIDPDDFASGIAATPDENLAAVMQSEVRPVILGEVMRRMAGEFRPDRASGTKAVIHFKITERPDGGTDTFELTIADGTCVLSPVPASEPKVTLEMDAVSFLKMISGSITGVDLYLGGQLKFDGQMMMLTRLTSMFNIPSPNTKK